MGLPLRSKPRTKDTSGIALFMVISAIAVLASLVTEFTYIAQVNQAIAFGSLDQIKAYYVAKSGLKLSLLRLKAFSFAKNFVSSATAAAGGGGGNAVSKKLLNQIWSFPFSFPLPTNLPGMSTSLKDSLAEFKKTSNLEGSFSTTITSESAKFNINSLLPSYQPSPSPSPSPVATTGTGTGNSTGNATGAGNANNVNATASPAPFDPQAARDSLNDFIGNIFQQTSTDDSDFANFHSDFKLDEFVDNVAAWEDRTYDKRSSTSHDPVPVKQAPFYSLTELHMLPNMEDDLYNLFTPNMTASLTNGVNINSISPETLQSLVPGMSKNEIEAFFKFRDSDEVDNTFNSPDDFYKYLSTEVAVYKNNTQGITDLKTKFLNRNITLVTDETQFKIYVKGTVNQSSKTIEAWVSLGDTFAAAWATNTGNQNNQQQQQQQKNTGLGTGAVSNVVKDPGIKITYMRIF